MKNMTKQQKIITLISTALFLLLIDYLTKKWAHDTLWMGEPINIIGDFFRLRFIWNPGSAFGILEVSRTIFVLINILIAVVFGYFFLYKSNDFKIHLAYIAIVVGGLGNIIDRFLYTDVIKAGAVVDFISIGNFPVFNFADIYVVAGTGFLVIKTWIDESKKEKAKKLEVKQNEEK